MPNQTAVNVLAAIKQELSATPGVAAASGAGAIQLRLVDSPGLKLDRTTIQSNEHRIDFVRPMGRLAGRTVGGSFNCELTIGGATDELLQAVLRSTWSPALVITTSGAFAGQQVTIATTGSTQTITASAGNWITAGLRVGDVITPSAMTTAANNNFRLRIVALTATVITVAGTALTNGANTAWTFTRLKKVTTSGVPTRYSYTIDQWDGDPTVDLSELFIGCRCTQVAISIKPNAIATIAYTFMGLDHQLLSSAASPWFTSPSLTTGLPLVSDDAAIRANGVDVAKFTGLDLNISIDAGGQPVIGSVVSPAIFDNDVTVSGNLTVIRDDFARLQAVDAETEFELSALFTEPNSGSPLSAFGIHVPRAKFGPVDAPFRGTNGPKIETIPLMIAPRALSSGYDDSAISFFSSAP